MPGIEGGDAPLEVLTYVDVDDGLELGFQPDVLEQAMAATVRLLGGRRKGAAARLADSIEVSLLITSDDRVRELNRDYRHLDEPTDVLSFPQHEGDQPFVQPPGETANLGDIVISLDTARRQALEQRHPLVREMAHLNVHGALHLMGYDHQTDEEEAEMNGLEAEVLKELFG